jgi:hypothetical protein
MSFRVVVHLVDVDARNGGNPISSYERRRCPRGERRTAYAMTSPYEDYAKLHDKRDTVELFGLLSAGKEAGVEHLSVFGVRHL